MNEECVLIKGTLIATVTLTLETEFIDCLYACVSFTHLGG